MEEFNNIIHQPIRLKIMMLLHGDKKMTFSQLKKELDVSDGNLWTHLEKLEKAWYIRITKSFVSKKPQTTIEIEILGERELLTYIRLIEEMIKGVDRSSP